MFVSLSLKKSGSTVGTERVTPYPHGRVAASYHKPRKEGWKSVGLREPSSTMLFDRADHCSRCWASAPQEWLAARRAQPACRSGVGVSSQQQDDDDVESAVQDQALNGIRAGVGFPSRVPLKFGRGECLSQPLDLLTSTITANDQDTSIRHRDFNSAGGGEVVYS